MIIIALLVLSQPVMAEGTEEQRYFEETNFSVQEPFLGFWEQNGGLPIFGFPISEVKDQLVPGGAKLKVQYFERARFELHPDGVVRLGHMGKSAYEQYKIELGDHAQFLIYNFLPGDVRYFPETSRNVHGVFLSFWETNGGLPIFGYPISSGILDHGIHIQYFERARFELHPDGVVRLGHIGREHLDQLQLTRELH